MDIITAIIDELESIIGQPTNTTLVDGIFFIFFDGKLIAKIEIKNEQEDRRVLGDVTKDFLAQHNISWCEICGDLFRAIRDTLPKDEYRIDPNLDGCYIDYYITKLSKGV